MIAHLSSFLTQNRFLEILVNNWLFSFFVFFLAGSILRWSYFLFKEESTYKRATVPTPSTNKPASQNHTSYDNAAMVRPQRVQGVRATVARKLNTVVKKDSPLPSVSQPIRTKQPYEAFLVLDVEATCKPGTDFNYPNEIIEFPVCLLRWTDRTHNGKASKLEVIDEFRSFVKPTWRPILSQFCTGLTGITQTQVDAAPLFPDVLNSFSEFLVNHGLIDPSTGARRARFCWCSDGPFDIRDFVVKQCFMSKIIMPEWLRGDVLDVRMMASAWAATNNQLVPRPSTRPSHTSRLPSLNLTSQLRALGLGAFEGREHSGIDDARNIARIIITLASKGVQLHPNTVINPARRWQWMGKPGEVLETYCL